MNYSTVSGEAYCLPDLFHLRKEERNVSLFAINPQSNMIGECHTVSPQQAILLAMFDGRKTVAQVCAGAAEAFGSELTPEQLYGQHILPLMERKFLVKASGCSKRDRYSPADFIIPPELTDMTDRRTSRPLALVWHLTERCFCSCDYCYAQRPVFRPEQLMSDGRMLELADEIVAAGVRVVTLAGGDPMQHPLVFDILKKLSAAGVSIYISTKTLIDAAMADRIRDTGIELMQVSLDSYVPETCQALHNYRGHGASMLESIKLLKDRGLRVNTNTVVTGVNAKDIPGLVEKLIALKVDRIGLAQYSRSIHNHKDYLFLQPGQRDAVMALAERHTREGHVVSFTGAPDFSTLSEEDKKARFPKRPMCGGLFTTVTVFPDGRLTICEQMPFDSPFFWGDLKKQSLAEAWKSPEFDAIRLPSRENFKGRACCDCGDFDDCHVKRGRCVRNCVQAYGDMWAVDPLCPKSKPGRRMS